MQNCISARCSFSPSLPQPLSQSSRCCNHSSCQTSTSALIHFQPLSALSNFPAFNSLDILSQMLMHVGVPIAECAMPYLSGTQASRSVSMKEREAEPLLVQHQGAAPVPRDHRPVRQWLQKLSGYAS